MRPWFRFENRDHTLWEHATKVPRMQRDSTVGADADVPVAVGQWTDDRMHGGEVFPGQIQYAAEVSFVFFFWRGAKGKG